MVGTAEGFLTTDEGIRLYYRTLGSGPQAVVIPGGLYYVGDLASLADGRRLIAYDLRNRGRSDTVTDPAILSRGIHADVDDLEAVRRHFGLDRMGLMGHSYICLALVLYAMAHPTCIDRMVLLSPMGPRFDAVHPPDQRNDDGVLQEVFARLSDVQKSREGRDPVEFCREYWSILRRIYVAREEDADQIQWDRCELENERNFMRYWMGALMPSIQQLAFEPAGVARVGCPVLVVHGRKDRSSPYGAATEWRSLLPHASLLALEDAGHAPWLEAAAPVLAGIAAHLA